MTHQEGQGLVAVVIVQLDRGGEVSQQGGYRSDRHSIEFERLLCFQHVQHIADGLALVLQRDDGTLCIVELDVEGDMQRQLLWLILGRRRVLAHVQTIDTAFGIVFVGHGELGVPDWLYQRRKRARSTPEASSIACTKSSQVAAEPS